MYISIYEEFKCNVFRLCSVNKIPFRAIFKLTQKVLNNQISTFTKKNRKQTNTDTNKQHPINIYTINVSAVNQWMNYSKSISKNCILPNIFPTTQGLKSCCEHFKISAAQNAYCLRSLRRTGKNCPIMRHLCWSVRKSVKYRERSLHHKEKEGTIAYLSQ